MIDIMIGIAWGLLIVAVYFKGRVDQLSSESDDIDRALCGHNSPK